MFKRAVLFGCQTGALAGVHNDVAEVQKRLETREFECVSLVGETATRANMLQMLRELIDVSRSEDAAVIYYSGHGGLLLNPAPASTWPAVIQTLVPVDFDRSDDFRGILQAELTLLLRELTNKTQNVTVFLDCCHASRMIRDIAPFRLPKVITRTWDERLQVFLQRHTHVLDAAASHIETTPNAVCLLASEQDGFAYEGLHDLNGRAARLGNFTRALTLALDEVDDAPVAWLSLMARVRELVMDQEPSQRPDVTGPSRRYLFSTSLAPARASDTVVYFLDNTQPAVRAGRLLGAVPGHTQYEIVSSTTPTQKVAEATVLRLAGVNAHLELTHVYGAGPRPGDLAVPKNLPFPPRYVTISGEDVAHSQLSRQVTASRYLEIAADAASTQLRIHATAAQLHVCDQAGNQLSTHWPNNLEGRAAVIQLAERLSRAAALREHLPLGELARDALHVEWGRVEQGQRIPMRAGETVHVGDFMYVDITNRSDQKLWVGILDIGITGIVTLLTSSSPSGRILTPSGQGPMSRFTLGMDGPRSPGVGPMRWPNDGPIHTKMRPEWLLVIVADHEVNYRTFETQELYRPSRDLGPESARGRYRCIQIQLDVENERRPLSSRTRERVDRGVSATIPRESHNLRRLSAADLQPGDVLLSMGQSDISEAIRGLDGGWYSHAALWTGDSVIESTDPSVIVGSLASSVASRSYVDVYRCANLTREQQKLVVDTAMTFLGRKYAYGDLLLGASVIASAAFLFRGNAAGQRLWLRAMNLFSQIFSLPFDVEHELLTCSELVARSYHSAGFPIELDITGLRELRGREVAAALHELATHHIPNAKSGELELLHEIMRFQQRLVELRGAQAVGALVPEDTTAKSGGMPLRAAVNWNANLVTPRDLMQSPTLSLVGALHP